MLKQKSKFIILFFVTLFFVSNFCYAENNVTTTTGENTTTSPEAVTTNLETDETQDVEPISEETNQTDVEPISEEPEATEEESNTNTTSETEEPEIHEDDLYLAGFDVTMDQLVNGNVYLYGNNITISGQIVGNLFVFGNTVNFDQAYIQGSVYVFANNVTFDAVASDLYITANHLEISPQFGVYRDLKGNCNSIIMAGTIGRNALLNTKSLSLEKDDATGVIYGNLQYSSPAEIQIPEGSVEGETTYTKSSNDQSSKSILSYFINLIGVIIFTLFVYALLRVITPASMEHLSHSSTRKMPKIIGTGLLGLIAIPIISLLLIITVIGVPTALALLALYVLLIAFSTSAFTIGLSTLFCTKRGIQKRAAQYLVLVVSTIIVWIVTILPFNIGTIAQVIFTIIGLGIILYALFAKKVDTTSSEEAPKTEKKEKKKTETKKSEKSKDSKTSNSKTENIKTKKQDKKE